MQLLLLICTVLLVSAKAHRDQIVCNTRTTLNFDDISTGLTYAVGLPQPYNEFVFSRVNTYTNWPDLHVPVLNTSNIEVPDEFKVARSLPNILITDGESLSMTRSTTFSLINLTLTSILQDNMHVFVNTTRRGSLVSSQIYTLKIGVITTINPNQRNIDRLIISCVTPTLSACSQIGYDNFVVCK